MLEGLLNDRTLVRDEQPARPLEVIQKDRLRAVDTLFGIIKIKRRYYYHTKARTGRCPLDESLDLVRGHTPGLARIICHASTHSSSFEEAAESLHTCLGLRLAGRNFGRMVAELAPILRDAQATLPAGEDEAPATLYISSDGTGVPLRRGELRGVKGKQPDGTARTREAKLGCVFTQTKLDEEGYPIRDPDSTTYTGTFEDAHHHGPQLRAEALRRGYAKAQRCVFLGDGAAWVWELARINFPDAVCILDVWHATEHIGTLADALFGSEKAKAQQTRWCEKMKATSSAPIITQARALLKKRRPQLSIEQQETIEREIGYFETNVERTRYGAFREAGYFIGSGVIEAGCKTVVGRRLKQSGMFWSQRGGDDLLALRCMMMNPIFPKIWNARLPILKTRRSKQPRWSLSKN
jgi:hypothetical protein